MTDTPITHSLKATVLPDSLPIFPLAGALLLPKGRLTLNVFEPRYMAMVEDAMSRSRLIGMIQPAENAQMQTPHPLYQVGCAGRIVSFNETDDGRYLITLLGLCRFAVVEELQEMRGYRNIKVDWKPYLTDMAEAEHADFDRSRLTSTLRNYFSIHGVSADWNVIQSSPNDELISSLCMICPLPPNEKQALLEAPTLLARADLLITLLEMACLNQDDQDAARH